MEEKDREIAAPGVAKGDEADRNMVEPPPADFSTFILSLSTAVLMHLGEIKNPVTDKIEKDRVVARHTIDIIDMLREKTGGNLTKDEAGLLEGLLYDLRMRYFKGAAQGG
ncbi:MAG: DUF1844 domain-containing protein [Deltaproteobacteria bacterium]|nr:DUF1844 domain-containing protein [Deltaproteobacteria bacterium]